MRMRSIGALSLLALIGMALSGCTIATTAPDHVALHYEGGSFSATKYSSYVGPSQRKTFGPGDHVYIYPLGQRSYDATGGKNAERGPITSSSKDSVELATPLSVTFNLKTDESTLRQFHEKVGNKYQAYTTDSDEDISKGWEAMLNFYVGQPLETTVDRVIGSYNWRQAYGDPAIRVQIETAVRNELPTLVSSKLQGDYFDSYAVQVQRPTPTNPELLANIAASQNQVASAEAAKAKADADRAAAQAQIAVQQAEAAKKKADISAYGNVDQYNKHEAIEKGINPYQPTIIYGGVPNK